VKGERIKEKGESDRQARMLALQSGRFDTIIGVLLFFLFAFGRGCFQYDRFV
jgi:hypothetical protein